MRPRIAYVSRLARVSNKRDGNWGLSRIDDDVDEETRSFSVATESIDSLAISAGIRQIKLLKMDIEGAERLALPGMTEGLAHGITIASCWSFTRPSWLTKA